MVGLYPKEINSEKNSKVTFIKVGSSFKEILLFKMTFAFLPWDIYSDLASTLAMIQTNLGCTVTAGQLLPFSWNGRRVKSPFNLRLLCPCIKSKGIRST